jgi:hypothetical protein
VALAACSPTGHKTSQANKPAVRADEGHTPRPVQDANEPLLFHGYSCGNDCAVHQAGYAWAANHKIADPKNCQGSSEEFLEGCRAYAGVDGPLGQQEIFQDED